MVFSRFLSRLTQRQPKLKSVSAQCDPSAVQSPFFLSSVRNCLLSCSILSPQQLNVQDGQSNWAYQQARIWKKIHRSSGLCSVQARAGIQKGTSGSIKCKFVRVPPPNSPFSHTKTAKRLTPAQSPALSVVNLLWTRPTTENCCAVWSALNQSVKGCRGRGFAPDWFF